MTVFIHSAASADIDAVSELLGLTWHATYDDIYGRDRVSEITAAWHSPKALAENLQRPHSEFIVADTGREIVGMAYAGMVEKEVAMLHQLYVHPDAQGRGAGAMLLGEICQCFPEARLLRLEVEAANHGGVGFYRQYGFTETGRTENCGNPQSGIPALVFERRLQ